MELVMVVWGGHNIIQIHNNNMWDWHYYVEYSHIFSTSSRNVGNI